MDLSTTYLGLRLPHPFMPGASPLADDLDMVKRLEDSGAAAIVLHSLFEEQIAAEQSSAQEVEAHGESFAEAMSYFPRAEDYVLGPDKYLEHLRRVKAAVSVPVIASLNGVTPSGWLGYARLIEEAGADALELNFYYVATDPEERASIVEGRLLALVGAVKRSVKIPVAVKLSPFFSSLTHLAHELDEAGADGLVLFNRFYQPDIDVEELEVVSQLHLSDPSELLLRLRWLAILSGRTRASLAVTGGVHTVLDAVKAVMTGAHAVQLVSVLLQQGPDHLRILREQTATWLEQHDYESLEQAQGSMNLQRCPDPSKFERGNYMRVLNSWRRR